MGRTRFLRENYTMTEKILVTGGAGFIGSHTCIELLNNGNEVVIMREVMSWRKCFYAEKLLV